MSDFWGDVLPNWIAAVSTLGALIAASIAGRYAAKAAHWTSEQAKAADRQVATQEEALALARGQAEDARAATERQRAESARVERNLEERRLDALAPDVLATARPEKTGPRGEFGVEVRRGYRGWSLIDKPVEFQRDDDTVMFRQSLVITLENVSGVPARVDIVDRYRGILEYAGRPLEGGSPVWVMPRTSVELVWRREVSLSSLVDGEDVVDPFGHLFSVELWARDVGSNVRNPYRFWGRVMDVEVDGTRVIVGSVPPEGWRDRVAFPLPRVYERLEAAEVAEEAPMRDGLDHRMSAEGRRWQSDLGRMGPAREEPHAASREQGAETADEQVSDRVLIADVDLTVDEGVPEPLEDLPQHAE